MSKNQKISYIGIGIALYVVVSIMVNIPIINRIRLDLGYIVFGYYLQNFGILGTLVGVIGCIIANLLKGGSFAFAWAIGQAFIGITLGYLLPKTKQTWLKILYAIVFLFIGIGIIKTILEVLIYKYPIYAKFTSNCVAYVADVIPFIIGMLLPLKPKMK